ncbi:MAG: GGDEF domain-containing protein [Erysipelotrichaceae bacterium]
MQNYSAVVLMSCLSLCVLAILVKQNNCLSKNTKRRFYITYLFIIIATLSEWLGIFLNGTPEYTRGIHAAVKAMDYIFTPLTGFTFAMQVFDYKRIPWIVYILIINTVLQIISIFTGWFFYIDEFNFYQHGPYYFFYMAVYLLVVLYLFISFFEYSKQFKKHNRLSLFAVVLLTCFGIFMQEFIKDIRTSALSLTLGSILLYIHYTEFVQQRMGDSLSSQKKLILTDAMTGLYSRYSYNEDLESYRKMDRLPDHLTVFSIDINGLKTSNDTLGHDAGDELIIAAARCIQHVLGAYGKCYRTGGDEFVAICTMNINEINEALRNLKKAQKRWHGYLNDSLSISVGYCSDNNSPIDEMITKADKNMYKQKEEYYRLNNLTPRV